jgi:hypothetical protein
MTKDCWCRCARRTLWSTATSCTGRFPSTRPIATATIHSSEHVAEQVPTFRFLLYSNDFLFNYNHNSAKWVKWHITQNFPFKLFIGFVHKALYRVCFQYLSCNVAMFMQFSVGYFILIPCLTEHSYEKGWEIIPLNDILSPNANAPEFFFIFKGTVPRKSVWDYDLGC